MKTASLTLFLCILWSSLVAQDKSESKAIHGFLGGLTIGVIDDDIQGSGFKSNAGAGGSLGYKYLKKISDNFSGSFEVLYNSRGVRYESPNREVQTIRISDGSTSTAENYHFFSFRYFEFPMMVYWHPNKAYIDHRSDEPKPHLKIGLGFSPALRVSAKHKYNEFIPDQPNPGPLPTAVGVTEKHRSRNFNQASSFTGNLLIDLHASVRHGEKSSLFTYLRYYYMLNSVLDKHQSPSRINAFAFGMGWMF